MDLRSLRYFVAVAEELHFGRAARRLHMAQPPLSRSVKQLETQLGQLLLHRSPTGVSLTPAGEALYAEARALLAHADRIPERVTAAAGSPTLRIGVLADSAEQVGPRLVTAFRQAHPDVRIQMREADLADPSCGLKTAQVDVALTRTPFDRTGIATRALRTDPVGVVMRGDDPLAHRDSVRLDDLAARRRFRLPEETDAVWRDYWGTGADSTQAGSDPIIRTLRECLQSVLWNGAIGLMPLADALPDGLVCVPLAGMPPSDLVVAWKRSSVNPLVRSFIRITVGLHGSSALRGSSAPHGSIADGTMEPGERHAQAAVRRSVSAGRSSPRGRTVPGGSHSESSSSTAR
ncbi:DNA-binding transcriptional LysR family regulator [Hamadaea flava]|uniref:LysR family transcriptional regulator n=1 Tax=Hamadaea flava TaxID=1742688 RepID=A0ABV8LQ36_9ACTN|nr:LysR substrate-binding domain-containing protein [Hamadaea flava]MCP2329667.1 DNA-binding transcriptional LysR family regulator [Hamadaea flava]